MAADFNYYAYTADSGATHRVRISTQSATAQTTAPTEGAAVTSDVSANAGGNRRRLGLHVRGFRLYRRVGTGTAAKTFTTFLPCLLPADYSGTALGASKTINGVAWQVSRKIAERSN